MYTGINQDVEHIWLKSELVFLNKNVFFVTDNEHARLNIMYQLWGEEWRNIAAELSLTYVAIHPHLGQNSTIIAGQPVQIKPRDVAKRRVFLPITMVPQNS